MCVFLLIFQDSVCDYEGSRRRHILENKEGDGTRTRSPSVVRFVVSLFRSFKELIYVKEKYFGYMISVHSFLYSCICKSDEIKETSDPLLHSPDDFVIENSCWGSLRWTWEISRCLVSFAIRLLSLLQANGDSGYVVAWAMSH